MQLGDRKKTTSWRGYIQRVYCKETGGSRDQERGRSPPQKGGRIEEDILKERVDQGFELFQKRKVNGERKLKGGTGEVPREGGGKTVEERKTTLTENGKPLRQLLYQLVAVKGRGGEGRGPYTKRELEPISCSGNREWKEQRNRLHMKSSRLRGETEMPLGREDFTEGSLERRPKPGKELGRRKRKRKKGEGKRRCLKKGKRKLSQDFNGEEGLREGGIVLEASQLKKRSRKKKKPILVARGGIPQNGERISH